MKRGDYGAQPILGVQIPKSNGKTRLLGIPTVIDRWLQQCVAQAITPLFEIEFKPHSYGFHPGKDAHQCVMQSQQYINEGFQHIVDIDLKSFFDEVDHCLLLQLLYRKVECKATLRLIRKWLRAPIMIDGKLVRRRKGVPAKAEKVCITMRTAIDLPKLLKTTERHQHKANLSVEIWQPAIANGKNHLRNISLEINKTSKTP